MLMAFFCFVQVGKLYTANLVHKHAAKCAVRAATVMHKPGGKNNPYATGAPNDIETAAKLAFGDYIGSYSNIRVQTTMNGNDPKGLVTVSVTATYNCRVPMGGLIVCLNGAGTKTKTETASLPLQGAEYAEE
jgi:hypothetical protein